MTRESPGFTASKGTTTALRGDGSFQRGFQAKSDARTTPTARLDNQALWTLNVQRSSDPMILENRHVALTGHMIPHLEISTSEDIGRPNADSISGLSRYLEAVVRCLEPLASVLSPVCISGYPTRAMSVELWDSGTAKEWIPSAALDERGLRCMRYICYAVGNSWSVGKECEPW